ALYQTKSRGRNDFTFYEPALSDELTMRHLLETELRRAIAQGELELHYQPIVDTKSGNLCVVEALLRWQHPEKGIILPGQFIPLAEESGLINQIGEWVLQAACTEAAAWPASARVAVNLSAIQLRSPTLPDVVMWVLARSGLPPERLELEI